MSLYSDFVNYLNNDDDGSFTPPTIEDEWARPSDWLALPEVTETDQKFVGLHAVFEDSNFLALTAAGDFTVDWGDGIVENFVAGAIAEHIYDYADTAFDGTTTSLGYKQAIVTVTPQDGQNLTSLDLTQKHSRNNLTDYISAFLDIALSGPNLTTVSISADDSARNVTLTALEQANIIKCGASDLSYLFADCPYLQSIVNLDTVNATTIQGIFEGCSGLKILPLFDTSGVTDFRDIFKGCIRLVSVPELDFSNGDDFRNAFQNCESLEGLVSLDLSSATMTSHMFSGCTSLKSLPAFSLATNPGQVMNMFKDCYRLEDLSHINLDAPNLMSGLFTNCRSLTSTAKLPSLDISNTDSLRQLFTGCESLEDLPSWDTSGITDFFLYAGRCYSLVTVPSFDTSAATTLTSMFLNCQSLISVPSFNTAAATEISNLFRGCDRLEKIPALDLSSVTDPGDRQNSFADNKSLYKSEAFNLVVYHSYANCKLSGTALNEIYNNLPTVTDENIDVSGNWGVGDDDQTIATNKGWTVIS